MKPEYLAVIAIFAFFGLLEAVFTRLHAKPGQSRGDGWVEAISTGVLTTVTQPAALFGGAWITGMVWPASAGALADVPLIGQIALLLIFDDLTQYAFHRLTHSVPWLYKLHRPHHEAPYMSVRIVYRNNVFYYLLMPGLWLSGALVHMGLGWVYAGYIVVKMTVIIAAHSDVRWDAPLYRIPALSPVMWVLERLISTPATHAAHHGRHASDGVTHYKGNFGNMLFIWDMLFRTAKITRRFPDRFGVENLPPTSASEQLF